MKKENITTILKEAEEKLKLLMVWSDNNDDLALINQFLKSQITTAIKEYEKAVEIDSEKEVASVQNKIDNGSTDWRHGKRAGMKRIIGQINEKKRRFWKGEK